MTIKGIDVSSYQPSNYSTSGLHFVFVKATEGTSYVNPKQKSQAAHGRAAGLVLGFYHFLHGGKIEEQVRYFVDACDSKLGDILACDWERPPNGRAATNAEKDAFIREVKRLRPERHRVVLYCNRDFWFNHDTTSYAGDGLWIADPTTAGKPRIKHPWRFHQYSSAGGIDRDVANFPDRAALRAWAG